MDQMDVSEVVRENKTNIMTKQVKAIIRKELGNTRARGEKDDFIYEQLMRNWSRKLFDQFNKLSAEEGKFWRNILTGNCTYQRITRKTNSSPFPFKE